MKTYLSQPELKDFVDRAPERSRLCLEFMRVTGCRISEALNLKYEDIDLTRGLATIRWLKHFRKRKDKPVPGPIEKYRTIQVDPKLLYQIKNNRKTGLVWPKLDNWSVIYDIRKVSGTIYKKPILNPKMGIAHHTSPHDFRRSFIINCLLSAEDHGDLVQLQGHCGHTFLATTLSYYRYEPSPEAREWYNRVYTQRFK